MASKKKVIKKKEQVRDQSLQELQASLTDARKELFEMRNQFGATKKLEQPHLMPMKRKEIARLLTFINEKQLQEVV